MYEWFKKKIYKSIKKKIKFLKKKFYYDFYGVWYKYQTNFIFQRRSFFYTKWKKSHNIYNHFNIYNKVKNVILYNESLAIFKNMFFIGKLFYKPFFYLKYKFMLPYLICILIFFFIIMILRCKLDKSSLKYKNYLILILNISDQFLFLIFLFCIFVNFGEFHRFFYLLSGFLCLKRAHTLLNRALDYNNNPKKPFCPRRMFTNHLFPMFMWSIFIYCFFKFYTKVGIMDFLQIMFNGQILFNPNKYCGRYENKMWWIHVRQRITYK